MRKIPAGIVLFCGVFFTVAAVHAQEEAPARAIPEGQRVMPVRIIRDYEIGTAMEQFASLADRLILRREKLLPDLAWKAEGMTVTPTAITVVNAVNNEGRAGTRLDFQPAEGSRGSKGTYLVDLDELKELEGALDVLIRAAAQTELGRADTADYHFVTRGGFTVSLAMAQAADGVSVSASIGKVSQQSREKVVKMFEDARTMIHAVVQYLSSQ